MIGDLCLLESSISIGLGSFFFGLAPYLRSGFRFSPWSLCLQLASSSHASSALRRVHVAAFFFPSPLLADSRCEQPRCSFPCHIRATCIPRVSCRAWAGMTRFGHPTGARNLTHPSCVSWYPHPVSILLSKHEFPLVQYVTCAPQRKYRPTEEVESPQL
jgi:hypothetical protein